MTDGRVPEEILPDDAPSEELSEGDADDGMPTDDAALPGDPLLTKEEVRALLGDLRPALTAAGEGEDRQPPESADVDAPAVVPWKVLLTSRRNSDAEALSERLDAHQIQVTRLNDPFRVLDELRTQRYDVLVSDAEIWVDGARVLFERLADLEEAPLVVFLSERRSRDGRKLLRAGAAGVLLCPLSPRHVELAVEGLLQAVRLTETSDQRPPTRVEGKAVTTSEASVAALSTADGGETGEVVWLRLLLDGQRLRREFSRVGGTFLQSFVSSARETLSARAACITYLEDGQELAFFAGASRTELAELAAYLSRQSDHAPRVGDWVLDFGRRSSHMPAGRLVLIGVPRAIWLALPKFEDDVRFLLGDQ